jgi:hypothetical protein
MGPAGASRFRPSSWPSCAGTAGSGKTDSNERRQADDANGSAYSPVQSLPLRYR